MYPNSPSSVLSILTLLTTLKFVFCQSLLSSTCILDIQNPSSGNDSNCMQGNWGGFLNENRCGFAFNSYLHGLGYHANQTGDIFLNSTEQIGCLDSMQARYESIVNCGIQKLSKGGGGCSDYSVSDVDRKLGTRLRTLDENCKLLGSKNQSDTACSDCLSSWEEMGIWKNSSRDPVVVEADICRFSVLVSMTSRRIGDDKWVQAVYQCLGDQSLPIRKLDQDDHEGESKKKDKELGILIGGILGIIVMLVVVSWILYRRSSKPKLLQGKTESKFSPSGQSSCHKIPIKEIYSATNDLSLLNFIGQGMAGKVYKGILSNGQHVAVKHIINDGEMETFVREVTSLLHIRHPNLVSLLGHCEGCNECFLVYELCENGTLSEWLFGMLMGVLDFSIVSSFSVPRGFIWDNGEQQPTNILVGANFQGKLSDFGLSKVMGMGQSFVSSEVRGTLGYVDPEYRNNHHVHSSVDVYSFGIVLLQILSGQRVINMDTNEPMTISKMANFLTRGGNITEFADPKLKGDFPDEAFERVMKLALSCTGLKQERPSMEQVVARLEKAIDISVAFSVELNPVIPHFRQNDS
ncbi:hypothetical protein RHSIM_Rhsim12G0121300 [Rhododendron simsii]|uniref:Protein kinase domain-containing protein n=1 Tax=Rhododendron simsii TaxID=118357 RepID=A0A834L9N0_RHOSS|nr:hypothetical protein RHSIM_Rhsim12G0121300 [Rhododendron simsii]